MTSHSDRSTERPDESTGIVPAFSPIEKEYTVRMPPSLIRERPQEGTRTSEATYLVVLRGSEHIGQMYRIQGELVVGRGEEADVPCPQDRAMSRLHARVESNGSGQYVLYDLDSKNGTWLNGKRVASQILKDGDIIQTGAMVWRFAVHDELEEQLRTYQKMQALGALAGGIAHEFNNLLAVILGGISYVKSGAIEHDANERMEVVSDMENACQQAANLSRQLLSFTQSDHFENQRVDVGDLVYEAVALARRASDLRMKVETDLEEGLALFGGESQLRQVLLNVFMNAQDAMPDGGVLRVTAKRVEGAQLPHGVVLEPLPDASYVHLVVSDTGHGMDEDTRNRVFDPFFTTKEHGRGTGLGMTIAYRIVRSHGGSVALESTVNVGTNVNVYLPAFGAAPVEASIRAAPQPKKSSSQGSILVVDDEDLVRRTLFRLLKSMGYSVFEARNGVEAVSVYRQNQSQIHMVLLDLLMPEMNGEEAYGKLRLINPDVQVVISSGYDDGCADAVLKQGAVGFLRKPYTREQLADAISKVFGLTAEG